ncbi:MAG: CsiV family protein [Gammaproteobacteria bacterium]|nr:CsiV family protein [Gammaproteobacteria bacterium]
MPRIKSAILASLFLLTTAAAHAQTTRYNIDVVIFEDAGGRYLNSEQWPIVHHPEDLSPADLTGQPVDKAADNQQDSPDINITHHASDALAEYIAKLESSGRYNILLQQSWQQTGLSDTDAINVHIDTTNAESPENDNNKLQSILQGTLKLILGRYLHLHTDLLYKRPKQTDDSTSATLHGRSSYDEFEIKSQRKMRSNELHYIDHPLIGILVLVSPIE